jgi:hypothetical protein
MATDSEPKPRLVELDPRRRVALGKVARPQDKLFLASVEPDGVIILTPVTLKSEAGPRT